MVTWTHLPNSMLEKIRRHTRIHSLAPYIKIFNLNNSQKKTELKRIMSKGKIVKMLECCSRTSREMEGPLLGKPLEENLTYCAYIVS